MLDRWMKILTDAQKSIEEKRRALMHEYGVKIVDTPRGLYDSILQIISKPSVANISMDLADPIVYLIHLTPDKIPDGPDARDSWDKLTEMYRLFSERNQSGIRVTEAPFGVPERVGEYWIDIEIPFSEEILYPLLYISEELKKLGYDHVDGSFYVVNTATALRIFSNNYQGNEEALKALDELKEFFPDWSNPNHVLFFNTGACEVIEVRRQKNERRKGQ